MPLNKPLKSLVVVSNTADGIRSLKFLSNCNAIVIPDQEDQDGRFFCEIYIRPEYTYLLKVILAEEEILEKENLYHNLNRFLVYLELWMLNQILVHDGVEIIDERIKS